MIRRTYILSIALLIALLPLYLHAEIATHERIRGITIKRPSTQFKQHYRRRVALCIGIDQYKSYPELECAVRDAKDMAGVFKGYGFDDITLITNTDAKRRKIVNELLRLKAEAEKDDLFVFFFAGHGQTVTLKDGGQMGYLIPSDCKQGDEIENAVSMGIIKDIADTMPNRHILFLVDSCYSGYGLARSAGTQSSAAMSGSAEAYMNAMIPLRSVQILTAGGKGDQAHESKGHGAFTRHVLDCLKGATADADDGVVSALEVATRVKQKVVEETKGNQNPKFGYLYGNGDVVFVVGRESREAVRKDEPEDPAMVLARLDLEYKEVKRLETAGEFQKAELKMSRLYKEYSALSGADSEKQVEYLMSLSGLCLDMQKYDLGLYYALELVEVGNVAEKAIAFNSIGLAYIGKGYYDKAIEYSKRAVTIWLALGQDQLDVAISYNNMGEAYRSKGEYDQAILYFQRALKTKLIVCGRDHPSVATSYNNIGSAYISKGEYEKAVVHYRKAAAILLKALGPDHPHVAISYNNIGEVYRSNGEYEKAIVYYEKSLGMKLKSLGRDHPSVATSYNNIGSAYISKGEYEKAIVYIEKALAINLKALGPDHPDIASLYGNLGLSYKHMGQFDKAIVFYEKALSITLKTLGGDHPVAATSYHNLGLALYEQGHYGDAYDSVAKALTICERKLGVSHPNTRIAKKSLDLIESKMNE